MEVVDTVAQDKVYEKPAINDCQESVTQGDCFMCNQCMENFGDRDALFKHIKLAHQQHVNSRRRFRCHQCQKIFKSMVSPFVMLPVL